ncbi:MAG: glycosyltransferase family 4 protein [Pseudonocardiaceae bacterium]
MTSQKQPTVIVALHDGFYGCGTGAGYANHALLEILTDLLPQQVRLLVLPAHLAPSSSEYDPAWHTRAQELLEQVNAVVHPLDNGTGGRVRFGGLGCFRHLVRHAADIMIRRLLPDTDPVVILALDAPFLGLAPLLPTDVVPNLVLVPRSTARIHAPTDRERIAWESYGMLTAAEHGGRIAAISNFMRAHLGTDYRVPDDALIELPDGLSPPDWQLTSHDDEILPTSERRGFLLAMGRAQPYKGFDDLLDALALLRDQAVTVPHLVLAAVTDDPEPSDYQQHLAKRITHLGLEVTLLTCFHPNIRRLLAHPALRGVVVPSRAEPFGRIPIESYAAGAGPVIATTAGGLAEQVIDGRTGFVATPEDPASLAAALRHALSMTSPRRDRMREEARQFAGSRYDHPCAVRAFLGRVAPWLEQRTSRVNDGRAGQSSAPPTRPSTRTHTGITATCWLRTPPRSAGRCARPRGPRCPTRRARRAAHACRH